MDYIPRIVEARLSDLFLKYPVITITGPRQSGKTSLVRKLFADLPYVNLENREERLYAQDDPQGFLNRSPDGMVIDEIQNVPELTSWIQVRVDEAGRNGMFVLTGSRQFEVMESVSQSLAGRTGMVTLLPFSIEELSPYLDLGTQSRLENAGTGKDVLLYKGLYPRIWDQDLDPVEAYSSYIATYVERDVRTISQIQNLSLFERFLGLCAGRIGQILNLSSLANDAGISNVTASQWLTILEASYIVYRLKPYFANIGKRLVKSPKLYFYDVGLVSRLLQIESPVHIRNHPLRGNLYENMVVSELLKYRFNRVRPDNLFFYRDSKGNEIDVVMDVGGRPIPIEVKSGETLNRDFFTNFTRFQTAFRDVHHHEAGILVYGGDRRERRGDVEVTNVHDLVGTMESLNL